MTEPLRPGVPSQIGSVVGVDRMDSVDRASLDPRVKLQLLCAEMKERSGRDPRAGGFVFVGRPAVILQLLLDLNAGPLTTDVLGVRLNRAVIVGQRDADVAGWWQDIPIVVRCTTRTDELYCIPVESLPPSRIEDRQRCGVLRLHGHRGTLDRVRELED